MHTDRRTFIQSMGVGAAGMGFAAAVPAEGDRQRSGHWLKAG
jgi:hypothetical protein